MDQKHLITTNLLVSVNSAQLVHTSSQRLQVVLIVQQIVLNATWTPLHRSLNVQASV